MTQPLGQFEVGKTYYNYSGNWVVLVVETDRTGGHVDVLYLYPGSVVDYKLGSVSRWPSYFFSEQTKEL